MRSLHIWPGRCFPSPVCSPWIVFLKWLSCSHGYSFTCVLFLYHYLILIYLRSFAGLVSSKWNLIMLLICISLNTDEAEQLFMGLLAIHVLSVTSLKVLPVLLLSLSYWFVGILYTFWMPISCHLCVTNVFRQSVLSCFRSFIVYFKEQKFLLWNGIIINFFDLQIVYFVS